MSQFELLGQRRFWPLFWTQFLGAFNDNVFKNALVILIAYREISVLGVPYDLLVVLCAGIFIAPFFLFSATAGQLADRVGKPVLVRWVKTAEVVVMSLAAIGFATSNVPLLLAVLFLMGSQSAFFGPTKYSLLPELLDDRSLVGGNALVEMATFLAILLGTITGGLLIAGGDLWVSRTGFVVVSIAVCGLVTAVCLQRLPAMAPEVPVQWDMFRPTWRILKVTLRQRDIRVGVLGISWFWFMGASFLALLPTFTKDWLGGEETVVTLFLALFCVGIAVGSLTCGRLSAGRLELGLAPIGCLGLSVFAGDLAWASWHFESAPDLVAPMQFLSAPGGVRIAVDLFLVALFAGLYTVPLYTLVQQRADDRERSRVIAGNNILNALLMVLSSAGLVGLTAAGVAGPGVFGLLAAGNLVVALGLSLAMPEFVMRSLVRLVAAVWYRVRVTGPASIPEHGGAILVANHVSFVDWLVLAAACPRPVRFVIDEVYLAKPVIGWLLRAAKVIPVAVSGRDPGSVRRALDRIAVELEDGQLVAVFPEGGLSRDGGLRAFKPGVVRLVRRVPAPVIPVALVGLWGSFFSRHAGRAFTRPFGRGWRPVEVRVGKPLEPQDVTIEGLESLVAELGGFEKPPEKDPRG